MHIIAPTAPLHGGVGFRNENVPQVENLPQLFPPQRYTPFTPYIPHYPHPHPHPLYQTPQNLIIPTFPPVSHFTNPYLNTYPSTHPHTYVYNKDEYTGGTFYDFYTPTHGYRI